MENICYFVSSLVRTGPTNQLSYIIKYLDRDKYNPIIITLFEESNKTLVDYFINVLKVEVICLRSNKKNALISAKKELEKLLDERKIDTIQTQGLLADYISFKQIRGSYEKISTIRNFPLDDYKNIFGKTLGNILAKKHINLIRNNRDSFVACSQTIRDTFKEQKNIELRFIQNGVDIEKFKPSKDKKNIRLNLGLPCNNLIFISVGSLIPRKDFTTLIQGFKLFNKDEKAILLIAGEGKEGNKLKSISNNQIKFLGNIPNVLEYLQASDCFVSSSLSEGLPNSVMEAMACALPCVLSNIPSHRELRGQDGFGHVYFKEQNIVDLHNAINKMVGEIAMQSKKSLEIVENEFSARTMSMEYQKLYIKKLKE